MESCKKTMAPMLARDADLNLLRLPLWASPKLDGVRIIVRDGLAITRSGKPYPNQHVQETFGKLEGIDGELILGSPCAPDVFNVTRAAVMSKGGQPQVTLYAFDCFTCPGPVEKRWQAMQEVIAGHGHAQAVEQHKITTMAQLGQLEEQLLALGYEGLMLRRLASPYKFGRSTVSEGYLLKLKRCAHDEARIVGLQQLVNQHGQAEEMLGAFVVEDIKNGVRFNVGSGLNHSERQSFWQMGSAMLGKLLRYRHFPVGAKDKPRFPVYAGLRSALDM